jgi:hypothetical protein
VQIENIKLHEQKKEKTQAAIEDERQRLHKQVQTMRGLQLALEQQINNL